MHTADPASVWLQYDAAFAGIDEHLDAPQQHYDDFADVPWLAKQLLRGWLVGPFLTLGRFLTRPPVDAADGNPAALKAGCLLRLAYKLATQEWAVNQADEDDPNIEPVTATSNAHELADLIALARRSARCDCEELKAAIRAVAHPLLPRNHDELEAWQGRDSQYGPPAAATPGLSDSSGPAQSDPGPATVHGCTGGMPPESEVKRVGSMVRVRDCHLMLTLPQAELLELALKPGGASFDEVRGRSGSKTAPDEQIRVRLTRLSSALEEVTKLTPFRFEVSGKGKRVIATIYEKHSASK